ncbi:TerD family protein [Streptomyces sp. NPDC003710]
MREGCDPGRRRRRPARQHPWRILRSPAGSLPSAPSPSGRARPLPRHRRPLPRHRPPLLRCRATPLRPHSCRDRTWCCPRRPGKLRIAFSFAGADADLTLFLTDTGGQVTCDEGFVFYNQPSAAHGAARLLGKQTKGPRTVERAALHLAALPAHIQRVTIAINMDVDTGLTCSALLAARTPGAVRRWRHCSRSAA